MASTGNPVVDAILAGSSNAEVREAMLLGSRLESGWVATAVGDNGTSFGPFQMHIGGALTSAGLTPQQAENPTLAVKAMLGSYTSAVNQVPQSLWSSNPEQAAEQAAVIAERPAQTYFASQGTGKVNSDWSAVLGALKGVVSGGGAPGSPDATTTGLSNPLSPSAWISCLANVLGVPSPKDLAERFGLIVLGAALILLGIYMLVGKETFKLVVPGAQQTADALPSKQKLKTKTAARNKEVAKQQKAQSKLLSDTGKEVNNA